MRDIVTVTPTLPYAFIVRIMFKSLILFHRRLVVLAACFVACLVVLIFQVSRLTLLQGTERFAKANDRLHWISFLPTWRGQITDRKGRVIAEDVACRMMWQLIGI